MRYLNFTTYHMLLGTDVRKRTYERNPTLHTMRIDRGPLAANAVDYVLFASRLRLHGFPWVFMITFIKENSF